MFLSVLHFTSDLIMDKNVKISYFRKRWESVFWFYPADYMLHSVQNTDIIQAAVK